MILSLDDIMIVVSNIVHGVYWYPVSFLMLRMYMAFLVGPDIPVSLNILILVFVVSGSWDKYLACWMTLEFL